MKYFYKDSIVNLEHVSKVEKGFIKLTNKPLIHFTVAGVVFWLEFTDEAERDIEFNKIAEALRVPGKFIS